MTNHRKYHAPNLSKYNEHLLKFTCLEFPRTKNGAHCHLNSTIPMVAFAEYNSTDTKVTAPKQSGGAGVARAVSTSQSARLTGSINSEEKKRQTGGWSGK
ncbi:hypothetical protein J1614_004507 [Plenodomus biglobosus]|nr:hypothetical protein J1614_004507 [Plenodomus biglobosus]